MACGTYLAVSFSSPYMACLQLNHTRKFIFCHHCMQNVKDAIQSQVPFSVCARSECDVGDHVPKTIAVLC